MLPNTSDKPLSPNGHKLLTRALKRLKVFALHSGLSDEEAVAMLAKEVRAEPAGRGGSRKGAGAPSRDWRAATGHALGGLQMRIIIEQTLAKGRTGRSITERQALGLIFKRRECGDDKKELPLDALLLDDDLGKDCGALFKAFQHARRRTPSFSPQARLQPRSREHRTHERLLAYANYLDRRGKWDEREVEHCVLRLGPSWVRVGTALIVNGQQIAAVADTA